MPDTPTVARTMTVLSVDSASSKGCVEDSCYCTPRRPKRSIEKTYPKTLCGAPQKFKRVKEQLQAASAVSLAGLDPLDDIDMTNRSSLEPSFYKMRLGRGDVVVPVTFIDKRAEVQWSGVLGQDVLEQLVEKHV